MMRNLFFLFLMVTAAVSCQEKTKPSTDPKAVIQLISSEDLAPLVGSDIQLVDVRTPQEVQAGAIEGSVNMNMFDDDFKAQVETLDKDKAVYVYCKAGGRSARSAKMLKDMGFTKVYDLDGGYDTWKSKGN